VPHPTQLVLVFVVLVAPAADEARPALVTPAPERPRLRPPARVLPADAETGVRSGSARLARAAHLRARRAS